MAEYIDKKQILKYLDENNIRVDYLYSFIQSQPTADVVEVKRGEWQKSQFIGRRGFYSIKDFVCNKCGGAFGIEQGKFLMNYCPNCGAKMDGERRDT